MLRKTLLVIVAIFLLVSVVQSPDLTADYVRQGVGLVALGVERILIFLDALLPQ